MGAALRYMKDTVVLIPLYLVIITMMVSERYGAILFPLSLMLFVLSMRTERQFIIPILIPVIPLVIVPHALQFYRTLEIPSLTVVLDTTTSLLYSLAVVMVLSYTYFVLDSPLEAIFLVVAILLAPTRMNYTLILLGLAIVYALKVAIENGLRAFTPAMWYLIFGLLGALAGTIFKNPLLVGVSMYLILFSSSVIKEGANPAVMYYGQLGIAYVFFIQMATILHGVSRYDALLLVLGAIGLYGAYKLWS